MISLTLVASLSLFLTYVGNAVALYFTYIPYGFFLGLVVSLTIHQIFKTKPMETIDGERKQAEQIVSLTAFLLIFS